MKYIAGANRSQIMLMPDCLDDYVGKDNVARVIEAFVNRVDLVELGFKKAKLISESTVQSILKHLSEKKEVLLDWQKN